MTGTSIRLRVAVAAVFGLVAAFLATLVVGLKMAPLVGWDVAAAILMIWMWPSILRYSPSETAKHAAKEDPSGAATDVLLLGASVASLVAVGFVIAQAAATSGYLRLLLAVFGVTSVVLSWALVHTIFTLRYAKLFYVGKPGGIDFNEPELPRYIDFAYLAFTIGMTFQVSDTSLETKAIRATALRHALLSYLFGTVIVATTINLIAGLSK